MSSTKSISSPPNHISNMRRLKKVASLINSSNHILILSGAGLSTSAKIPDFRSLGGFYNKPPEYLVKYNLEDPSDVFDLEYFRDISPVPFFEVCRAFICGKEYHPTLAHHFIHLIHKKGKLQRYYTQNIDGLDEKVGEYEEKKIVYCHGSFRSATCVECGERVSDVERIMEHISEDPIRVPTCQSDTCGKGEEPGVLKPDIVLFGEALPKEFHESLEEDTDNVWGGSKKSPVDLILILGTSLNVAPVSMIPDMMPKGIPRVLINMEPVGDFEEHSGLDDDHSIGTSSKKTKREKKKKRHASSYEDYFLPGDLQTTCAQLLAALGWDEEIDVRKPKHVDDELIEAMKQMKL